MSKLNRFIDYVIMLLCYYVIGGSIQRGKLSQLIYKNRKYKFFEKLTLLICYDRIVHLYTY